MVYTCDGIDEVIDLTNKIRAAQNVDHTLQGA